MPSDKLNPKQKRFVEEYLKDLNATQAAIRAGYSKKTAHSQGPRLLDHVGVSEAIQKGQKKLSEKAEISVAWVIEQLQNNHIKANVSEDFNASNKALELIGKHLGAFIERVQHSGDPKGAPIEIGLANLTDEQIALLRELYPRDNARV